LYLRVKALGGDPPPPEPDTPPPCCRGHARVRSALLTACLHEVVKGAEIPLRLVAGLE
jgi:hypothetical protein